MKTCSDSEHIKLPCQIGDDIAIKNWENRVATGKVIVLLWNGGKWYADMTGRSLGYATQLGKDVFVGEDAKENAMKSCGERESEAKHDA